MQRLSELKARVAEANRRLVAEGLVTLTWGNVSGIDREAGLVAIKPSGVPYDALTAETVVVVDMEGNVVEGDLRPSSDTATHLALYRDFTSIGGVCHTHSRYAVVFSQLRREIPCLGTTHADHFFGAVPLTRPLTEEEVDSAYEVHTGTVIVERFREENLDPEAAPGVLVAGHGPFTWGNSPDKAVDNAVALEAIAAMAWDALALTDRPTELEDYVLRKHYLRKHGPGAYYGQRSG
ncbi:L-ribulose-5-phosphate 4-epimerase [Thermostilla marina]